MLSFLIALTFDPLIFYIKPNLLHHKNYWNLVATVLVKGCDKFEMISFRIWNFKKHNIIRPYYLTAFSDTWAPLSLAELCQELCLISLRPCRSWSRSKFYSCEFASPSTRATRTSSMLDNLTGSTYAWELFCSIDLYDGASLVQWCQLVLSIHWNRID